MAYFDYFWQIVAMTAILRILYRRDLSTAMAEELPVRSMSQQPEVVELSLAPGRGARARTCARISPGSSSVQGANCGRTKIYRRQTSEARLALGHRYRRRPLAAGSRHRARSNLGLDHRRRR